MKKILGIIIIAIGITTIILVFDKWELSKIEPLENEIAPTPIVTLIPEPTATPTPRPLTLAEMNAEYGPCAQVPTILYHHIQNLDQAQTEGHKWQAVAPEIFQQQMEYLKTKGYNTILMSELTNFFDQGAVIPPKSVLITFDDAYADLATDAFPVLNELGLKATVFVPTGLMDNPNYLSWSQITSTSSNIQFANHTWSHQNSFTTYEKLKSEIGQADEQLVSRRLNLTKVFAYPYGSSSVIAEKILSQLGYQLAFTTNPGSILCKQQRFDLPRLRIGNLSLSSYGF